MTWISPLGSRVNAWSARASPVAFVSTPNRKLLAGVPVTILPTKKPLLLSSAIWKGWGARTQTELVLPPFVLLTDTCREKRSAE